MVKRQVKKKAHDDYEDMAKYDKRRRSRQSAPLSKSLERSFELDQKEWDEKLKDPEYFRARVVEVHKKYSFVSPEPKESQIDTRDVWLATVAK
ncbi:hypothetical protein MEO40_20925, partial [Dolichospermum sp. ST_sed1]|nr:hypothetical protein [Dolichospermum sp. ST_sed1]